TTEWIGGSPEGTVIHGQTRLAPPGERCVAVGPRGFHAEQVFPGTGTWEAALLLALAPFAVWPVLRRMAAEVQVNRLSAG
ncbi:MAG: hypothetical protein QOE11_2921, partial [Solirubrobacteraceae bacterium]|nr:hypothetical protein [Solirubrobacteraceae bacterium]